MRELTANVCEFYPFSYDVSWQSRLIRSASLLLAEGACPIAIKAGVDDQMPVRARSCGNGGQDQNLRKSGRSSCHHTSPTLPTMLEPLIGPQYRLSHEIARLSPSM